MQKKFIIISLIASLVISVAGCSQTDSSATNDNTAASNNADVAEITKTATEATEEQILSSEETTITEKEDYSEAKAKVDTFWEHLNDYKFGVITNNKSDCWFYYESHISKENGGQYKSDYWKFYVTNEDTKEFIDFSMNPTANKDGSGLPLFDYHQRVGYGNFKIYAVYDNDESGVYFYAEDEITLNESNVSENGSLLVYHYNLTELVGEDFTAKTYQLDK